jgi:serine/threonine-protein kinase
LVLRGKYRLEQLIGEGGMGAVWRAHHLQLDLAVAVKLLRENSNEPALSARMKVEAQAAARLAHPAIVRVFDIDSTEGGAPYIVMELLEGESLADVLDRGPMPAVKAVQALLPIAEALVLAHEKGIFHRDLKPPNIMLTPHGEHVQPKLLDFGIAKLTTSPLPSGSLTETGIAIGSPDYMSPEQARGSSDVDYRADIWQLCVVLYEALTNQVPFQGDNYNALMRAIVEDEPQPLPLDGQVDERLAELVAWGLAKKREDRPDSVRTLGQALAAWLLARGVSEDASGRAIAKWLGSAASSHSTEGTSAPVMLPEPRSRPRVLWLVVAGSCLAAAVAWLVAWGISSRPAPGRGASSFPREREGLASPAVAATEQLSIVSAAAIASSAAAPVASATSSVTPGASLSAPPSPAKPDSRAADESRKHVPAVQSGRVVHDETRELLQAY